MAKKLIGELSIPDKYTINQTIVSTSWDDIEGKPEFAVVAETGNYDDLNNKPEIPSIKGLATKEELNDKQDKLTAGNNITIVDNVISSTASGGSGSVTGYAFTTGQVLTDEELTNLKQAMNNGLIPITIDNELVTGCYVDEKDFLQCITQPRGSKNPKFFHHQYSIPLNSIPYKIFNNSPSKETFEKMYLSWPISFSNNPNKKTEYDWLVDYVEKPYRFYLTINDTIVYYMEKSNENSSDSYITLYAMGKANTSGSCCQKTYTIYFTDKTYSALDKTKNYYNSDADIFITTSNWQNYITTSGGDDWTYSNEYDGNLYSAKEIVILWNYNDKKYCNYYKLPENQYLGNYQNQNFSAGYVDMSGTEGVWYYDGVQIQNSNMNIEQVIFKT